MIVERFSFYMLQTRWRRGANNRTSYDGDMERAGMTSFWSDFAERTKWVNVNLRRVKGGQQVEPDRALHQSETSTPVNLPPCCILFSIVNWSRVIRSSICPLNFAGGVTARRSQGTSLS